jgi:hypothetical protein
MDNINFDSMTDEQLEETMGLVGVKMDSILVKAKEDVNKVLEEYGLCVELGFEIKLKG